MENSTEAPARPVVLIANIGNRNVTYALAGQEVALPDLFLRDGPRFNFRERTRALVQEWASRSLDSDSPFDIHIFADHLSPATVAVHLFVTDQQTVDHPQGHPQDTLFAGELCRRVLETQYTVATSLHQYAGNPTDEDAIYAYMAPVLQQILAQYPAETHDVVFVDAGGTPGMKTVAKSLLRYYRPSVQVVYTAQAGPGRASTHAYHDRYVLLHVARQFVQASQYRAAHDILRQIEPAAAPGQRLLVMLRIAAFRRTFNQKSAQTVAKGHVLIPSLKAYLQGHAPAGAVEYPGDIPADARADLFELASLCQHYLTAGRYELAIPTYYRLCEEIGQRFAEARGFQLRHKDDQEQLVTETRAEVTGAFPGLTRYSPAYLLGYAAVAGTEPMQQLLREITPTISRLNGTPSQVNGRFSPEKGLNMLRNRCFLAHDNKPITQADVEQETPGFLGPGGRAARIFALLGQPETNIYDQMNQEILALFQQE